MEKQSPVTEGPDSTTTAILNSNLVSEGTRLTHSSIAPGLQTTESVLVPGNADILASKMNLPKSNDLPERPDAGDSGTAIVSDYLDNETESKEKVEESQNNSASTYTVDCSPAPSGGSIGETEVPPVSSSREATAPRIIPSYDDVAEDSWTESEDDDLGVSGDESDIEDNDDTVLYPGQFLRRDSNPVLPETTTVLVTDKGCKVYLVGTAHFSKESQDDVAKVIQAVQPDVVMVELCSSRINVLQMDENTLLEEAKNINFEKIRIAIKQGGVVQGVMHLLLLSMSAHITKQLGMAPGGEFRTAFKEARKVPGCRVHLGDRPIQVTLRRAIASLNVWQKLRLGWYMIFNKDPISKEEVEKCKQKDLLEEMLAEMTGEFPALSNVFVGERDLYLTNSLRLAAEPLKHPAIDGGTVPSVVVGVVGIGHSRGIVDHWNDDEIDIRPIMQLPKSSLFTRSFKWIFRASMVGLAAWLTYRIGTGWILPLFSS